MIPRNIRINVQRHRRQLEKGTNAKVASGTPGCPSDAENTEEAGIFSRKRENDGSDSDRQPSHGLRLRNYRSISLVHRLFPTHFPIRSSLMCFPRSPTTYIRTYISLIPVARLGWRTTTKRTRMYPSDTRKLSGSSEEIAYRHNF
ncbi:hypothetical protein QLX08_003893 [Tetragonisca angustula]|uniref:Uncharacterized protein n=1 Tax=Tetragonisca angustula TaxID=166442 RepID=A0AAW1A7N6_9HYME